MEDLNVLSILIGLVGGLTVVLTFILAGWKTISSYRMQNMIDQAVEKKLNMITSRIEQLDQDVKNTAKRITGNEYSIEYAEKSIDDLKITVEKKFDKLDQDLKQMNSILLKIWEFQKKG